MHGEYVKLGTDPTTHFCKILTGIAIIVNIFVINKAFLLSGRERDDIPGTCRGS